VIAIPTTTVSIWSHDALTVDDYGDPAADDTPTAIGVPASIIEQNHTINTHADGRSQIIRTYTCRLPAGTDTPVRLRDETTGDVYLVDAVTQPANPHITNDIRCDLRRAS
jgi:hypothetical protein